MSLEFVRWLGYEYENNMFLEPIMSKEEFEQLCEICENKNAALMIVAEREMWREIDLKYIRFKFKIKKIIKANPGILQNSIRNHIPDEIWHEKIPRMIKKYHIEGKIERIPHGNTYELYWNEE